MALLFSGANIAFAEESGGFIGFGIGGGGTELKSDFDDSDGISAHLKAKDSGISYGFVAGYKQFFNDYLGLRYYANLDIYHNINSSNFYYPTYTAGIPVKNGEITIINYGVNVDFLGNFVSAEIADFGGFIGLGIGGTTLTGKFINDFKNLIEEGNGDKINATTGFDIWLNIGLRTNIAKYHGIELVARVPFLPVKMIDLKTNEVDYSFTQKQTLGQKYNILARYTFSF